MFRKDMEKNQSSSVAHFRCRILAAVENMQASLGVSDLGVLYYKPIRDSEGTMLFITIKNVQESKQMNCLSLRWLPLTKLHKRAAQQRERENYSERVSDSGISIGAGFDYSPAALAAASQPRLIGDILVASLDVSSVSK